MTRSAYADVMSSVGHLPAENGALLGGDPETGIITEVRFDADASRTGGTYSPDVAWVNRLLREEWNPAGIRLLGFAHSHPASAVPSSGDRAYAGRILEAIPDLDRLALPIALSAGDGRPARLRSWIAERAGREAAVHETSLHLIDNEGHRALDWFAGPAFDRVASAVSLPLLARTRLIVVGAGGSAGFVETMVRQGVGEVVLIDPDTVDLPNLATQQTYRSDVGTAKVRALGRRLLDINPDLNIREIPSSLDALTDRFLEKLATRPWIGRPAPEVALWCGFTDDFWAQARVNRLALHLGQPMIAAQVYEQGRGVEVSFAAPGITAACGRCVLGSRYRAWLDRGWTQPGRSAGTPLPATERLNALKGQIALALVHGCAGKAWLADPASRRWRTLLERIADRNLVLVRLDPDIASTLGLKVFDDALRGANPSRFVMDETVWLPQLPERPEHGFAPCGDCGGTGDLRNAIGTFADTRLPVTLDNTQGEG